MTGGEAFHHSGHRGGHHGYQGHHGDHGRGKHRPESGSWIPLPERGHHHPHAKAVVAPPGIVLTETSPPIEPAEILITTVPITGLRSFDLGTVPASVTPPRTWRKAAWFAVAASVGVLIALAAAATAFVGRPSQWTTIDALPSLPGATDLITTLPSIASSTASRTSTVNSSVESPSAGSPDRIRTDPSSHSSSAAGGASEPRNPTVTAPTVTTSAEPAPSGSTTTEPGPKRSTLTPLVMSPPVNAEQIGDRTEAYYDTVVDDPNAAYAMTSGPMQDEGPEGIKRRYEDVTGVQVEQITIDPATGRTMNTVRLHHRDGSVTTQRRTLTFSAGKDPRITNETTG
jgi:hypothetical protein